MIPVVMPSQDTNRHTVSDDLCQQHLCNDSGGQLLQTALPSQLQMEVQAIASFNTPELSTNLCWQQSSPPESPSHPFILLTVYNYSNTYLNTLTSYCRLLLLILCKNHAVAKLK